MKATVLKVYYSNALKKKFTPGEKIDEDSKLVKAWESQGLVKVVKTKQAPKTKKGNLETK